MCPTLKLQNKSFSWPWTCNCEIQTTDWTDEDFKRILFLPTLNSERVESGLKVRG